MPVKTEKSYRYTVNINLFDVPENVKEMVLTITTTEKPDSKTLKRDIEKELLQSGVLGGISDWGIATIKEKSNTNTITK